MAEEKEDSLILVASVSLVVILALIGLTVWNTIAISKIEADEIELNRLHLCWMTGMAFGPPKGDSLESCDELRHGIKDSAGTW